MARYHSTSLTCSLLPPMFETSLGITFQFKATTVDYGIVTEKKAASSKKASDELRRRKQTESIIDSKTIRTDALKRVIPRDRDRS